MFFNKKRFYVYAHKDSQGQIFYIGKGTGRRAWSKDRLDIWERYVNERLGGQYTVELLHEKLSEPEAEEIESQLISQYGGQLVNWINPGRDFDYEALELFHKLRDANRLFVSETRGLEKINPKEAVARYNTALEKLREYDGIVYERGLVAELTEPFKSGEPEILDRLTLCLVRLGRVKEAKESADQYFAEYPDALKQKIGERIKKRVEKNLNGVASVKTPKKKATLLKRADKPTLEVIIAAKKSEQKKPGYYQGKHFTHYVEEVKDLMRVGKLDGAEDLLLSLIAATEKEAEKDKLALPPFYVEKLAILYSKMKRKDLELEILERYEAFIGGSDSGGSPKLVKRLSALRTKFE